MQLLTIEETLSASNLQIVYLSLKLLLHLHYNYKKSRKMLSHNKRRSHKHHNKKLHKMRGFVHCNKKWRKHRQIKVCKFKQLKLSIKRSNQKYLNNQFYKNRLNEMQLVFYLLAAKLGVAWKNQQLQVLSYLLQRK